MKYHLLASVLLISVSDVQHSGSSLAAINRTRKELNFNSASNMRHSATLMRSAWVSRQKRLLNDAPTMHGYDKKRVPEIVSLERAHHGPVVKSYLEECSKGTDHKRNSTL